MVGGCRGSGRSFQWGRVAASDLSKLLAHLWLASVRDALAVFSACFDPQIGLVRTLSLAKVGCVPRANRYFVPGKFYHLTHRCHDRQFLFKFGRDRNQYRQ